jgi:phospholipid/cholesterol/gamma-HCH transport system substrate-binding protein
VARTAKIGLLVATALAIFMVTILSLGQEQRFWERKVQYELHFARTNGLQKGALVSLTGVPIGSVDALRFPPDPSANYIQVLVNVTGDVTPRIREDTVASIRTIGLLGDRYIELSAGSADRPALPPGSLIHSVDPVEIEAVLGQSGDIATNVLEVTASLRDVLQTIQRGEGLLGALVTNRELGEGTLRDLRQTMANVQQSTEALEQIIQRVNHGEGLIGQLTTQTNENRELVARVNRAARDMEQFTHRLNHGRGALPQLIDDEAYARRVLDNLDSATRDLARVAARLERGEGTLGKLMRDPTLYDEARGLVGRARRSWVIRMLGGGGEAPPAAAPLPPSSNAGSPPP